MVGIFMSDNRTGNNIKNLIITVTDNYWLGVGVKNIFPEVEHLSFRFDSKVRLSALHSSCKIFIAVDSLIFLRGKWTAYNSLFNNDVIVIWLVRKETGSVLPSSVYGGYMISQKNDIASFRKRFLEIINASKTAGHKLYSNPIVLTRVERYLLPYFMLPMQVPVISKRTRKATKSLYTHRSNIMTKLGNKNFIFLQLIYNRNQNVQDYLLKRK